MDSKRLIVVNFGLHLRSLFFFIDTIHFRPRVSPGFPEVSTFVQYENNDNSYRQSTCESIILLCYTFMGWISEYHTRYVL